MVVSNSVNGLTQSAHGRYVNIDAWTHPTTWPSYHHFLWRPAVSLHWIPLIAPNYCDLPMNKETSDWVAPISIKQLIQRIAWRIKNVAIRYSWTVMISLEQAWCSIIILVIVVLSIHLGCLVIGGCDYMASGGGELHWSHPTSVALQRYGLSFPVNVMK